MALKRTGRQNPRHSIEVFRDVNGGTMRFGPFMGIAILLFVLWICGFLMFHIASGLIHLLLLFAVISLLIHLFSGSRGTT
jgi:uncharacterized protein DUF5670